MMARSAHRLLLGAVLLAVLNWCRLCAGDVAADFDAANKLYEQGKYSDAVTAYEKLASRGLVSPALYFNLGNAFFKSGQIGRALSAYRHAADLTPRDPDIRANLQFARNQVQGPTVAQTRWQRWLETLTVNEWTALAAAPFWLLFLLLAAGRWRPALRRRSNAFAGALGGAALVLFACLGLTLYQRHGARTAVVIAREAIVRQGPLDEAQNAFVAHDGAELKVLDEKDDWLQVSDGQRRIGWLKRDAVVVMGEDSTRAKKS